MSILGRLIEQNARLTCTLARLLCSEFNGMYRINEPSKKPSAPNVLLPSSLHGIRDYLKNDLDVKEGTNFSFKEGGASDISQAAPESFGVIACVLDRRNFSAEFAQSCHTALRPGGVLGLAIPRSWTLQRFIENATNVVRDLDCDTRRIERTDLSAKQRKSPVWSDQGGFFSARRYSVITAVKPRQY